MTDAKTSQDVSVMYATALAASIIDALPKSRRARAAVAIKAHVREINARENTDGEIPETHSEVRSLLQTFFESLVANEAP